METDEQPGAEDQPETAEVKNPADHLKDHRWQKGESGNPEGRPPGFKSLWRRLADHVDDPVPQTMYDVAKRCFGIKPKQVIPRKVLKTLRSMTMGDFFVRSMMFDAITGQHLDARRMIFDRVDGRLPQVLEGPGHQPLIPNRSDSDVIYVTVTGCDNENCEGCEECRPRH